MLLINRYSGAEPVVWPLIAFAEGADGRERIILLSEVMTKRMLS